MVQVVVEDHPNLQNSSITISEVVFPTITRVESLPVSSIWANNQSIADSAPVLPVLSKALFARISGKPIPVRASIEA